MPKNEVTDPTPDQDAEKLRRKEERREQVLDRLWEIAAMPPERTRNSITGQVKALQMIAAIECLIPDRRAASSEKKSASPLPPAEIYQSACLPRLAVGLGKQQEKAQPNPTPAQQEEDPRPHEPDTTPVAAAEVPPPPVMPIGPAYDRSQFACLFHPSGDTSLRPQTPSFGPAPDARLPLWQLRIPSARRRR